MDVNSLLTPRSDAAPSGENLEYDQAFVAMEVAASPSDDGGDSGAASAELDFASLEEAALAVLERSHDLRAGAFLALAKLRREGLEGGRDAIRYIRGCLEQHWDTCFPEVEDGDVVMRANAVAALADSSGVVAALRRAPLASSRALGSYSFRDISIASGEIPVPEDMDDAPNGDTIAGAFSDTPDDVLKSRMTAIRDIRADLEAIEAAFEAAAPGFGPDLAKVQEVAARIAKTLSENSNGEAPAAAGAPTDSAADLGASAAAAAAAEPAAAGTPVKAGPVRSPEDVRAMLDQIMAYYRRDEPSSPVPVLLSRARRLVGADFISIVKDIAPEGMENVALVGGLSEEVDDDE